MRNHRVLDVLILSVGMLLSTLAGTYAYRQYGPYGDGPFGANFYRDADPAAGESRLFHESQSSNGRVRHIFDTQYNLRAIWVDTKRDGKFALRLTVTGQELVSQLDVDLDGKPDRWEHFDLNNRLIRIGSSVRGDGVEDTWTFPDINGLPSKVETDVDRDGVIDKREIFGPNTDGSGRTIAAVESEFDRLGTPHFRTKYRPDGSFEKSEILGK